MDTDDRLTLILMLWRELKVARKNPAKCEELIKRIRHETDAFRAALWSIDVEPQAATDAGNPIADGDYAASQPHASSKKRQLSVMGKDKRHHAVQGCR